MNKTFRFILMGIISFLILLGVFVSKIILDQIAYKEHVEKVMLENVVNGMHLNIQQVISIVSRSLDTFNITMPEWIEQDYGHTTAEQRLKAFNQAMPGIKEVSIFDSTGHIWASSCDKKTIDTFLQEKMGEILSTEEHQSTMLNPFIYLFEPTKSDSGSSEITIVRPIQLSNGKFSGGILAVLPTSFFISIMKTSLISEDSKIGLTWNNKTIVFQMTQNTIDENIPVTIDNNILNAHFLSEKTASIETSRNKVTNSKRIVAFYTLLGKDQNWSNDLTITIGRDYSEALHNSYFSARLYILLYILICAVTLGAFISIYIYQKIVNKEKEENQKKLEYMAQYDQLTDLPNRELGLDRLKIAISRLNRKEKFLAVMFIDLDGFKTVNDTWGHDTGDHLLRCISENMKTVLRESDTLARFGGDEFIAIFEDMPTKEQCITTATRLLENASKTVNIRYENDIRPISVTASIGIVFDALKKYNAQDLIKFADTAMYEAKQSGKNRFVFYEE